jgi:hypothetical protein
MKVGDLVEHKLIDSLGIGLVTELDEPHYVMVCWSKTHPGSGYHSGQPILEVACKLELVNESR